MIRMILVAALLTGASAAVAQTVQLITEDEARLPAASRSSTRAITRGPGVKLVTPGLVGNTAFAFKVAFEPHGGSKVEPASVQVVYLKSPPVDLTSRIKAGISAEGIELASARAPAGEHPIRIFVRDNEGRQNSATFTLVVR